MSLSVSQTMDTQSTLYKTPYDTTELPCHCAIGVRSFPPVARYENANNTWKKRPDMLR